MTVLYGRYLTTAVTVLYPHFCGNQWGNNNNNSNVLQCVNNNII